MAFQHFSKNQFRATAFIGDLSAGATAGGSVLAQQDAELAFVSSNGQQTLSMADMEALSNPVNASVVNQVAASTSGQQKVIYNGLLESETITDVTANHECSMNF